VFAGLGPPASWGRPLRSDTEQAIAGKLGSGHMVVSSLEGSNLGEKTASASAQADGGVVTAEQPCAPARHARGEAGPG